MTKLGERRIQELIDAHGSSLVLYARQWCRAPEDAVQEAFIDLSRLETCPAEPAAWLHTAVRRRAMNLARAEGRRSKHHREAGRQRESWFLPAEADLEDDPVDFPSLLARLPTTDREIVIARIWGELSFVQIAELVGQSTSTVHRRYQAALLRLEALINQPLDCRKENDERRPTVT